MISSSAAAQRRAQRTAQLLAQSAERSAAQQSKAEAMNINRQLRVAPAGTQQTHAHLRCPSAIRGPAFCSFAAFALPRWRKGTFLALSLWIFTWRFSLRRHVGLCFKYAKVATRQYVASVGPRPSRESATQKPGVRPRDFEPPRGRFLLFLLCFPFFPFCFVTRNLKNLVTSLIWSTLKIFNIISLPNLSHTKNHFIYPVVISIFIIRT